MTNHTRVLVLDASYLPLGVIAWEQAIVLLLDEKARMVADYAGRVVRSPNLVLPWPAVVALTRYVGRRRKLKFNRQNVLARDRYTCAYCGVRPLRHDGRPDLAELTLDHVVPRAQSRGHRVVLADGRKVPVTSWENVVTCCVSCNARKADRTPTQAGLALPAWPRQPNGLDAVLTTLARVPIPNEWRQWVPPAWRDYWTVELQD